MNKKNYASERPRSAVQIDLYNYSSEESSSDHWKHKEKHHVSLSHRLPENYSRNKYREFKHDRRPPTPPPPVISSQSASSRVKYNTTKRYDDEAARMRYPPHRERLSVDYPSPPRNFSFDPDYYANMANIRDIPHLQMDSMNFPSSSMSFDHNSAAYRNQRSREERSSKIPQSDKRMRNLLEPKKLTLTIVDEGPNPRRLNVVTWSQVSNVLCTIYLDIMREYPGPPPVCREASLFLGCAKVIECADERSLKLYSLAISRVGEVWPGAKLAIVDTGQISTTAFRIRATSLVPAEPSTYQAILECIQLSNPDINTRDWTVLNVGGPSRLSKERHIIISFDVGSLAAIERRRRVINYGFDSIILKTNRRDMDLLIRIKKRERIDLSNSRKRRWPEEGDEEEDYENEDDANFESGSDDDEGID